LTISISALEIELNSDDGMRNCDTYQKTIQETIHGEKKDNHQNPRKANITERKRKPKTKTTNPGARQRSNNERNRTETAKE
jgi:hypothetical protein